MRHDARHRRPIYPGTSTAAALAAAGVLLVGVVVVTLRVVDSGDPVRMPQPKPGITTEATVAAEPPSNTTAPAGAKSPPPSPAAPPRILFGIGPEADTARQAPLVRQAPVKMLTSWYNSPNDLSWITGWRTGTVPSSYAAGFAMHLIVYTKDAETTISTADGTACGRAYPLASRFLDDMRRLAETFAGDASGPPLYVTLFTEFQTYPCVDNAWSPNAQVTAYYQALKGQYAAAYRVFHANAPNARVSLGWGGWQAGFDQPATGGGRSLFAHFDDVLRMSDFQSFQSMRGNGNVTDIKAMVATLGKYGPVMLAHYKPDNGSQMTFNADVAAILTDSFLASMTANGLFALSFMDGRNLDADAGAFDLVRSGVSRYGRSW